MLSIPPNTTIYWHTEPTDMRKGIDGLSGIVRGEFDGDPLDGSLYLFVNSINWESTGGASGTRRPLCEFIKQTVLATDILGTDDTSVTLLVPNAKNIPPPTAGDLKSQWAYDKLCETVKQGKPIITAKMWAYRSVITPLTFFDFTLNRKRAGPGLVLEHFQGKLMADCYLPLSRHRAAHRQPDSLWCLCLACAPQDLRSTRGVSQRIVPRAGQVPAALQYLGSR